ncbi:MAG: thioredoxin-disulfide reductase [Ignavibacteriaceae bacterium]|nr:thioredoxin-disulfide reductase [Ignavibacteriaceae bacterium]
MSENNHRKVIIIGSGPAGFTAAIYTGRANLNPLIFEGMQPGGQLTITTDVENYPGFEHGIMGPEMMEVFRKQAQRFGAESVYQEVTKVDFSARPFKVFTYDAEYTADSIIVSTGASAKLLGIDSENNYMGYGVSACATCDGFFYRGQKVVVVGGGDTAMEEANYLTRFASEVTVIHRRDQFRASKIMTERAQKNPKIKFLTNKIIDEVTGVTENGKKRVTGGRLRDTVTGEISEIEFEGLFVAIGHQPNTSLFNGILDMDETGYLIVKPGSTYTNIEGVFAAGDVADKTYRQAVTAAGSGCMAAIDAERWLESQEL